MHDISDQSLVLRTRGGDKQAYGELVERYQGTVFNVCLRLLGERHEAEDLMQDAFLRAHARLGTYDENRPFGPWIRRVAANLCLNRIKRRTPLSLPVEELASRVHVDAPRMPEQAAIEREQQLRVRSAILALPPHYRVVIELRHYQGLSYAEIGAELGIPLSDVKSHLFRARKLLAEGLEDDV